MLESDDIEADVRAAMEGVAVEVPDPIVPDPAQAETGADDHVRDEKGRFAPKEAKTGVETTPETAQAVVASPQAGSELPATEAIRPPASWSATAKAQFNALPPVVQQEVLKREKDMDAGLAQWKPKGERLNRFDALIEPLRDRLTLSGVDEFAYFQALMRADEMLRGADRVQALTQIAQMYGINLPNGAPPPQQPQQQMQAPADPYLQLLMQRVDGLQETLSQQQQRELQSAQAREAQEIAQLESHVESFRKEHIYFDNVRPEMERLLRSELASDLPDAYAKACKLNPEVSVLLAAPPPKPAQPQTPRSPAGLSVTGSPGLTAKVKSSNPHSDIEDDVRAAFEEVTGRI